MVKITEEAKIRIFGMNSIAEIYGETNEDFGRFMRGFYQGMITVLGALGIKRHDVRPAEPPDNDATFASFCASYGSYLHAERKPRLNKDSEDHAMLYGHDAQKAMAEAERCLKEYKKEKRGSVH